MGNRTEMTPDLPSTKGHQKAQVHGSTHRRNLMNRSHSPTLPTGRCRSVLISKLISSGVTITLVDSIAGRLEVHKHRRSRSSRLEEAQGSLKNCVLAGLLARCVERVAMRKRDKECPRRLNALRNLSK